MSIFLTLIELKYFIILLINSDLLFLAYHLNNK